MALTHIFTILAMIFFQKLSKPHARIDLKTKEFIIEYSRAMKSLPIIICLFFAGLFILVAAIAQSYLNFEVFIALFILITALIGLSAVEIFGVSHRLSKDGIYKHNPWSRDFFIDWNEIQSISYNEMIGEYIVKSPKGKIKFNATMNGMDDFYEFTRMYAPCEIS